MGKLTAKEVDKLFVPKNYTDGDGLLLSVKESGAKSWILKYQLNGKRREMGLGKHPTVSLKEARDLAADQRKLINAGIDPIDSRNAKIAQEKLERQKELMQTSFKQVALDYISTHRSGWKNEKHIWQWENTLERFAYPVVGELDAADITTDHVVKILKPIWEDKTETATRLRSRIELILDAAKVRGLRTGENPARWKGHLDKLLSSPAKIQKVRHHPAFPYEQISDFWRELTSKDSNSAKALQLLILTATRTSEVLNATWDEFDLNAAIWTIPAERMKMGKEHRVPLSRQALELLTSLYRLEGTDYVFVGVRSGKPLSNLAMLMLMRQMGYGNKASIDKEGKAEWRGDYVPHGFRSTFRDWAGEVSSYSSDVAEMALAHSINNKVEAAYRRGDLLAKRADMMQDWADFIQVK